MLLQYVSLKEYQCPKAAALLCAAPFPRKLMVLSKYIFCMLVYIICCLIFGIETILIPQLGSFHMETLTLMFLITALFISLYLPAQYKLGYEKTKFAFFILIMASPIVLAMIMKMGNIDLDALFKARPFLVYGGMILTGSITLIISAYLSVKIYNKTDLA